MKKEFIPYQQALELKELGFNEDCLGWYQDNTLRLDINSNQSIKFHEHLGRFKGCLLAPLYQQCWRWFREKYGLIGWVCPFNNGKNESNNFLSYGFAIKNIFIGKTNFENYEEAELDCLKKLIEIVKNK